MSAENDFVEYLLESLRPLGSVRAKKMFGGFGIFLDGIMFGLVSRSIFYLKVDEENRQDFESKGLGAFTYTRKGKEYSMSYYEVPYEAMDDAEELCHWASKAHDAAVRVLQKQRGKKVAWP